MNRFDDNLPKLDDDNLRVDEPTAGGSVTHSADESADDVLEKSDECTDKIPADLGDTIVDSTQEVKGRVDS